MSPSKEKKEHYLKGVLKGIPNGSYCLDAVIFMYHAEVPMELARQYVTTYVSKLPRHTGARNS